ncbi:MAG: DUF1549 and DUF1553 domain-containing protein [Gemmataceae bacterium]|nr:DUF1549 and DUF1553 domain-containing protein [Gemmataceae bacterium]
MRTTILLLAGVIAANPARADEVRPPARVRFAPADVTETPDFQRHVVPLLGRLGCNGRACHGSFQGQGGFRLSLFGHDLSADHQALTRGAAPRVTPGAPAASLVLQKPTLAVQHKGGKRFERDGWEHRLLWQWIKGGARPSPFRQLDRLEVTPPETTLRAPGESTALRVTAHWHDGVREDVTCLCRFQTNDDAVADVDADGRVSARGKGATHIIVFYDKGVAAVPAAIPVSDRIGTNYPAVAAPTKIDELATEQLRRLGIVPSELCSDADFLRRASLDLTGTLPAPDEVERFLADRAPDRRARKIDELLDSPAYAAWWANIFGDFTGNSRFRQSDGQIGQEIAERWYAWLHRRLRDNTPYDQIMAGLLLAGGRRDDQGYADYAAEMSSYFHEREPADFAKRPDMPFFWTRRTLAKPEDKALAFAHTFLGIRLQCAQCHKHPFDQWTQSDFTQLAGFFAPLTYGVAGGSQGEYTKIAQAVGQKKPGRQGTAINAELLALAAAGKSVPWRELFLEPKLVPAGKQRLLGEPVALTRDGDPRQAIWQWLRRPDNPYFARALVNRVWSKLFHAGLVEPVDDLNLANPPSNPAVLDFLARDFVDHGYDIKQLLRTIANSHTYQRSWQPNATNGHDRRHFSRAVPRRLPAEVLYDALTHAVAADAELVKLRGDPERRAIGHLSTGMAGTYALNVFGKPDRSMACDCERSNAPSLLQAIFLRNDPLVHLRLRDSGWLRELAKRYAEGKTLDDSERERLVRQAFLRTLSRPPTAGELRRAGAGIAQAESVVEGVRDLLWALVNTKEFVLNH